MKATGMVRNVDNLGRVVVPKELRTTLGIENGDPVEIFVDGEKVVLKKYQPGCHVCAAVEGEMSHFYGRLICDKCVKEISERAEQIMQGMKGELA